MLFNSLARQCDSKLLLFILVRPRPARPAQTLFFSRLCLCLMASVRQRRMQQQQSAAWTHLACLAENHSAAGTMTSEKGRAAFCISHGALDGEALRSDYVYVLTKMLLRRRGFLINACSLIASCDVATPIARRRL
jgi:hypothetical protein